jgi:hypothetical protein
MGFAQKVEEMTDEELLAQHDYLVPFSVRLEELCREMSKRAKAAADKLTVSERISNLLKK